MWDQLSKHLNGTKPGTFLGWCVKLIFFRQLTRNDRGLYMLCYNCSLLRISINDIFCRLFWIFLFQARPHDTAPTPPPSHQNANYVIVRQFIAQTSDQLTVYEGELVTLERADPDWAYGKLSSFYKFYRFFFKSIDLSLSVKTFRNGRIESGWVPAPFLLPREIQHEAFRQHQASPKRQVSLFEEPWYHGRITRVESQRLLESGIAGSFLGPGYYLLMIWKIFSENKNNR